MTVSEGHILSERRSTAVNEFDGNSLGFPQGDYGPLGAHYATGDANGLNVTDGVDTKPLGGNSL